MQTTLTEAQLKAKLQKLINESRTLNSLPANARKTRANLMLASDPATMQKFIEVLENETAQMKKIDDDFQKNAAELGNLIAEAKHLETEANTILRKEAEKEEQAGDQKKAEELLAQLDKISGE